MTHEEMVQSALSTEDMQGLADFMELGSTALFIKAGGKYPDGVMFGIATRYVDGVGVAGHFATKERCEQLRDQLCQLFPGNCQ